MEILKWLSDLRNVITLLIAIIGGLSTLSQYTDKKESQKMSVNQIANIANFYNKMCEK